MVPICLSIYMVKKLRKMGACVSSTKHILSQKAGPKRKTWKSKSSHHQWEGTCSGSVSVDAVPKCRDLQLNDCMFDKISHSLPCHVSDFQVHYGDAIQVSFTPVWRNLECVYCDVGTVSIWWETCNQTLVQTRLVSCEDWNSTMCHLFFFHQAIPNAHILITGQGNWKSSPEGFNTWGW